MAGESMVYGYWIIEAIDNRLIVNMGGFVCPYAWGKLDDYDDLVCTINI